MSSAANTGVSNECQLRFSELKRGHKNDEGQIIKYVIFKLVPSGDFKSHEVHVEKEYTCPASGIDDKLAWNLLKADFENATLVDKKGNVVPGPRYGAFDFDYSLKGGDGRRKKIVLIDYCPDTVSQYWRMIHASSLHQLKASLSVSDTLRIDDDDGLVYKNALHEVDSKADLSNAD